MLEGEMRALTVLLLLTCGLPAAAQDIKRRISNVC